MSPMSEGICSISCMESSAGWETERSQGGKSSAPGNSAQASKLHPRAAELSAAKTHVLSQQGAVRFKAEEKIFYAQRAVVNRCITRSIIWRISWSRRRAEGSVSRALEAALAQEVAHLRRRVPVQRESVQAAQHDVVALARQVGRCERDGVV